MVHTCIEEPTFVIERRGGPLLVSIPHLGTTIPDDLRHLYTEEALTVADTDWHLDRLYSFAKAMDATVLRAKVSRYVIDLNRPTNGDSLYPGLVTTTLCPAETFRGEPVYAGVSPPDAAEVERRVRAYWRPYHDALKQELQRLRASHANVLLWEAHSIASVLPRLFSGKLPSFNFGTADGQSCARAVIEGALDAVRATNESWVLNGRFKGGFITRRYGAPGDGIHAIQLEMCQSLYMDEAPPFGWRDDLAQIAIPTVQAAVQGALDRLARLPQSGTMELSRS
ncbi:N-formylglutamate deformylase [Ramlibacter sp. MAH-25]|uniref:N-formylglutamate deformylase n=2 Tax=Comamonadaceae TaxID=80864 RepID=A0A6N8ISU5_9BURK|nr:MULTISPECIES: N-formylglutamate deformylase [Ramlibacter]MBA2965034.1 N-formylglutamate deformylase [Ramlibacter sp. CGMCC 1.13660]MVQ29999.1 N-formylglutamate deformylase [Ramlibacter pinisoli]